MPHGYLKHAPKGEISRREMRGGGSGKASASAARRRMKEIKLGADGFKKGSRGHGGKGALKRDLMEEVQWSSDTANASQTYPDKRRSNLLPDTATPKPVDVAAGSRVRFEAEPGVLVEGIIIDKVGGDFVVEVEGGVTIPGVRREQLYLAPACAEEHCPATDSFVFVSAPLPQVETVGAPLPRMEISDAHDPDSSEPVDMTTQTLIMTWARHASTKHTPQPPPSFQALQAEDEARQSVADTSSADSQLPSRANPRVVRGLQAMGFDAQLCVEAALSTGNENIEKAARWLVDALDQHELARKEQHETGESEPAASVQEGPVAPAAIGFVAKLAAALTGSVAADQTDEADEAKEDGWEVVRTDVQE